PSGRHADGRGLHFRGPPSSGNPLSHDAPPLIHKHPRWRSELISDQISRLLAVKTVSSGADAVMTPPTAAGPADRCTVGPGISPGRGTRLEGPESRPIPAAAPNHLHTNDGKSCWCVRAAGPGTGPGGRTGHSLGPGRACCRGDRSGGTDGTQPRAGARLLPRGQVPGPAASPDTPPGELCHREIIFYRSEITSKYLKTQPENQELKSTLRTRNCSWQPTLRTAGKTHAEDQELQLATHAENCR
ncbi:Hypp5418, partial [Branchiostoma lanceolatum]